MARIAGSVLLVLLLAAAAAAQTAPFEVRGLRWGMSEKDVLRIEKKKPKAQQRHGGITVFGFEDFLHGLPTMVGDKLVNNKLMSIHYEIPDAGSCEKAGAKFVELLSGLRRKYGQPFEERDVDTCMKMARWRTDGTTIFASVLGDGPTRQIEVLYENTGLAEEAKTALKNADAGKL